MQLLYHLRRRIYHAGESHSRKRGRTNAEEAKEKPWHIEGMENQEWVLLDYVDVVVHVFHRPLRSFYQLEELWSDGILVEHNA